MDHLVDGRSTDFDFPNDFPRGPEFLQRLFGGDGEDEYERVPFGNVESLHGRELVRSRRVRDL